MEIIRYMLIHLLHRIKRVHFSSARSKFMHILLGLKTYQSCNEFCQCAASCLG